MSANAMEAQQRLQAASAAYQQAQAQLQDIVDARGRLGAQLSENEAVHEEFKSLTPQNEIYKLVGPVLVKQDAADARSNVDKRLEFIRSEIKRVEEHIAELEGKATARRNEIAQLQASLQAPPQEAA